MTLESLAWKYNVASNCFGEELLHYCLNLIYCDIYGRGNISLNRMIHMLHITYRDRIMDVVQSLETIYDAHQYCSTLEKIIDRWINERYYVPAYDSN